MVFAFYDFVLISFMVASFLPYGFPTWKVKPGPVPEGETRNCEGWLDYYGFSTPTNISTVVEDGESSTPINTLAIDELGEDLTRIMRSKKALRSKASSLSTKYNREKSFERGRQWDAIVHKWAAIYAQYITTFHTIKHYVPKRFCKEFLPETEGLSIFIKYEEMQLTCEGWILLYKYDSGVNDDENVFETKKFKQNQDKALFRNVNEDENISIWAALYARFLAYNSISPKAFCKSLDIPNIDEKTLEFMSFINKNMKCLEWIQFSGYTDDIGLNIQKANNLHMSLYIYVNWWTRYYVIHLRHETAGPSCTTLLNILKTKKKNKKKTPEEYCRGDASDSIKYDYFAKPVY